MPREVEVRIYASPDGTEPYTRWETGLRDRAARARIRARTGRLRLGNFGAIVIFLCGGDKRSQARDIERAEAYWLDHRSRNHDKKG